MAKLNTLFFFLLLHALTTLIFTASAATTTSSTGGNTDFVRASCTVTLYPTLCVESLSGYASTVKTSERRLALAALSVSVSRARAARSYVSKVSKSKAKEKRAYYQAVKDCVEHMSDSVDRLSQSVKELGSMGAGSSSGEDFVWHMSNVQTWVSAALTDDTTCTDGLSAAAAAAVEEREKANIKRVVTNVARVTSNALALVNRFSDKHHR